MLCDVLYKKIYGLEMYQQKNEKNENSSLNCSPKRIKAKVSKEII